MARKLRSGGSTSDSSLDRTKKYKYSADGTLTEFTGEPGDTDIVFTGSKSNLRRIADLERNVSIIAATLKTTDGNATDSDDASYPDKFTNSVRFKSDTLFNDTMLVKTTIDASAGTVDAGTLKIAGKQVTATGTELNKLDGATVSTAELNILDGATVSTAELNILDGVTATTAELNYMDGVTSNVQTQINTKAPTASPTFTGTTTIPTVDINGGNIDGTTIGGTTAAAGNFTTIDASSTITGDVTGDLTGNVTGDVTGDVTGNVTGNLDGIVGGNTPAAGTFTSLGTSGNVTVGGNLTVSGTTTTVNSNTVNIGDSVITLNSDETGAPSQNGGFEIERGSSSNVSFVWDETNDEWTTNAETLKTGHMLPETDVTYDLGSSSLKWRDLYLSGSTIKLGSATISADGSKIAAGGGFSGNADTASTWETARTLSLTGAVTGSASIDGSGNVSLATTATSDPTITLAGDASGSATLTNLGSATLTVTVADDSHNHVTSNIDGFDAAVRTEIEGADLDLGTNKILFSNVYSTTGDLPSASSYHGMFAHVHGEGAAYFAHSGNWVQLAKQNQSPTVTLTGAVTGSGTMTNLGNVSISTTATADPTLTLTGDVSGSATFTNLGNATLTATVANDSHSHSNYIASNANDTATGVITFSNTTAATSATTGAVKISGGLGVGGAIYAAGDVTAYSDDRLKTNIHEIENGLDKVMALRGITFERIADGSISTGVSAQDVHAVLPEAVSTDEEGLMAVKYGNLVGLLIEAIKDLKEEVNELKAEKGNTLH